MTKQYSRVILNVAEKAFLLFFNKYGANLKGNSKTNMKAKISIVHIIIITLVVAILTAIIVPIVINSNNYETAATSDEATVDILNEALTADEEANGKPSTLCGVWKVLENAGYNSEVAPLYNNNAFYYYSTDNIIVLVTDNVISYPSSYTSGIIFSNLKGSAFIDLNTLATEETAHDSAYASGTCGVCGAVNPD